MQGRSAAAAGPAARLPGGRRHLRDRPLQLAPHRQLEGAEWLVWISKVEPIWWQAVEVRTDPAWIVFPWEDSARAAEEERR